MRSLTYRIILLGLMMLIGYSAAMAAPTPPTSRPAHDEGEAHEHTPRHGGQVGDADDIYHYEVLLKGERRLVVYVGDEENRPLDVQTLESRWTLNPDSANAVVGDFTPSEDGAYLWADVPDTEGEVVHVKVEVLKDENWIGMEFYLEKR